MRSMAALSDEAARRIERFRTNAGTPHSHRNRDAQMKTANINVVGQFDCLDHLAIEKRLRRLPGVKVCRSESGVRKCQCQLRRDHDHYRCDQVGGRGVRIPLRRRGGSAPPVRSRAGATRSRRRTGCGGPAAGGSARACRRARHGRRDGPRRRHRHAGHGPRHAQPLLDLPGLHHPDLPLFADGRHVRAARRRRSGWIATSCCSCWRAPPSSIRAGRSSSPPCARCATASSTWRCWSC